MGLNVFVGLFLGGVGWHKSFLQMGKLYNKTNLDFLGMKCNYINKKEIVTKKLKIFLTVECFWTYCLRMKTINDLHGALIGLRIMHLF